MFIMGRNGWLTGLNPARLFGWGSLIYFFHGVLWESNKVYICGVESNGAETLKTNIMNTSTAITEGTKFTITGMLNGQAGRKFIKGTNGIVTDIKVVGKGTKFETTMVVFKTEKNSMNLQFGGVAELSVFTANAETI